MEGNSGNTTGQPQPGGQQPKGFVCGGDCLKCSQQQRLYCSAQHGQQVFMMMGTMLARLGAIENAIGELRRHGEAVRSAEGEVFNPLAESNTAAEEPLV